MCRHLNSLRQHLSIQVLPYAELVGAAPCQFIAKARFTTRSSQVNLTWLRKSMRKTVVSVRPVLASPTPEGQFTEIFSFTNSTVYLSRIDNSPNGWGFSIKYCVSYWRRVQLLPLRACKKIKGFSLVHPRLYCHLQLHQELT
jgi:hypothetical protein